MRGGCGVLSGVDSNAALAAREVALAMDRGAAPPLLLRGGVGELACKEGIDRRARLRKRPFTICADRGA